MKIKKVYLGRKQIYPDWWSPGENTIAYYPLETNANDYSWNNYHATTNNVIFTETWNLKYAEVSWVSWSNRWYCSIPAVFTNQNVGTWDFTVSMRVYPVTTSNYPMAFWDSNNNPPYYWINIFLNENGKILFRLNRNTQKYSTSTYSSLIWSWHHIVYTRIEWTCIAYIDSIQEVTPYTDTTNISQSNWTAYFLWRQGTLQPQGRNTNWAKFSKIICEKVWWTAQEISNYFNQTKWNYWL